MIIIYGERRRNPQVSAREYEIRFPERKQDKIA